MHPDDQQRVLDWMLEHKDVTITKFAKVASMLHPCTIAFGDCVNQCLADPVCGPGASCQLLQCCRIGLLNSFIFTVDCTCGKRVSIMCVDS